VFDQFRTTWREFCTTPGAKFNEYRPTTAHELATGKRLVRTRWRKIRRISLHEKKEKISLVQNSRTWPDTVWVPLAAASALDARALRSFASAHVPATLVSMQADVC
jgi:hypothetical protein